LAACVNIAFADATSGGQEVCPIPAEAERATTIVTLNAVASSFLISLSSSSLLRLVHSVPLEPLGLHFLP